MIEIEATNYCNTRCIHCPRERITRPMGKMSWETFRLVVDKVLPNIKPDLVNFSGMGEPTLNPLLPDFVAYLSPRVPAVQITTNASALNFDLIADLEDAGLDNLFVSFNGHTDALYAEMMGGLSLSRARENIKSVFEIAEDEISVLANVSVTNANRDYLPEIRAYLQALGIRDIFFSQCHNRGGHLSDCSICDTPVLPFGEGRCDILAGTLFITWDGKVLSCCHDLGGEAVLGDLNEDAVTEILDRKQRVLREGVRFPMCQNCNDLYRFVSDPTLDDSPLSEWIYALYAREDERTAKFQASIAMRDRRIYELEQLVSGYENGWCIRTIHWFKKVFNL